MPILETKIIRTRDQNGRLIEAGYQWLDPLDRSGRAVVFGFVGVVTGFIGLVCRVLPRDADLDGYSMPLLVCAILCFWLVYHYLHVANRRERSIIFQSGGKVLMPNGVYEAPDSRRLTAPYYDIATIEERSAGRGATCMIFTCGGETIAIVTPTFQRDVHRIVVQLNQALVEIRDADAMHMRGKRVVN